MVPYIKPFNISLLKAVFHLTKDKADAVTTLENQTIQQQTLAQTSDQLKVDYTTHLNINLTYCTLQTITKRPLLKHQEGHCIVREHTHQNRAGNTYLHN